MGSCRPDNTLSYLKCMPLPPNAKKVFTGEIFDVYQWEQELYDGSTATFEMLKRPGTVDVIAEKNGEFVILHQDQPTKENFYSLPGGRQDPGETAEQAAKRELMEETGLISDNWELYKEWQPYNKVDWTISYFIAKNCAQTDAANHDAGEKIRVEWHDFDGFIERVLGERYCGHEFVEDVLRMKLEPKKLEAFKNKLLTT